MGARKPEDLHREFGNAFNTGTLNSVCHLRSSPGLEP